MTKPPKRPRDLNQWAKRMVDIATGEAEDSSKGITGDRQKIVPPKRTKPPSRRALAKKA
jgi:hypothetical protein